MQAAGFEARVFRLCISRFQAMPARRGDKRDGSYFVAPTAASTIAVTLDRAVDADVSPTISGSLHVPALKQRLWLMRDADVAVVTFSGNYNAWDSWITPTRIWREIVLANLERV